MLTANQNKFIYWINERERVRLAKEANLPKPWSSDPVFQKTYFTNVNREDDRVTKWIRQNWNYRFTSPGLHELAMAVARLFNEPDTLFEIGYPAENNLDEWLWIAEDILEARRDRGDKIWNGAYMLTTHRKKVDKVQYYLNIIENLIPFSVSGLEEISSYSTLEEAYQKLRSFDGLGSFLAAQIVADLKNSDGHPLTQASDWRTFSAHGPGSLRGLSWFWEVAVSSSKYQYAIENALDLLQFELNEDIMKVLCMQNLQNCFCEFDKYMRVSSKTGRSKRNYPGE